MLTVSGIVFNLYVVSLRFCSECVFPLRQSCLATQEPNRADKNLIPDVVVFLTFIPAFHAFVVLFK